MTKIVLVAWATAATLAWLYWWGEALMERWLRRELLVEFNRRG